MIKIIEENKNKMLITMAHLEPLQVGKIVDEGIYDGHIVIRTAYKNGFEVIDLSDGRTDGCWTNIDYAKKIAVELLKEPITIKISN